MAAINVLLVKKLWDSNPASGAVVTVGGVSSYTTDASGYIGIESTGVTSGANSISITYGRHVTRAQSVVLDKSGAVVDTVYIIPNKRYI